MSAHWDAAGVAANSAQLLLDSGDCNGAVNRAYYDMFHAANAKTHTTVIRRFGLHVAGKGGIDTAIGRSLARVEQMRLIADYDGPSLEPEDALTLLVAMRQFLAAVAAHLKIQAP